MTMPDLEHALDALAGRVSSLREARAAYPKDLAPTLDAALAELDTAAELLAEAREELRKAPRRPGGKKDGGQRELKLLRQVFRAFPVPVIVLDGGGVVRRINPETSRMLGSPDGYLVGRSFPLLVDVSRRAAFRSHLTAVLQTGQPSAFETRLAHQGRTHTVQLALTRLTMPGEPQQMIAAVALPTEVQLPEPGARRPEQADGALLLAAARRQDLLARMARLLLEEDALMRPGALQRATRLLAAEWADWVIADLMRDGLPHRAAVMAPKNHPLGDLVRQVESADPAGSMVVMQVLDRRSGVVQEMVDDESVLGFCAEGPLLTVMGAGSLLSVPIGHGDGVLTLVRAHDRPPFGLADLAVMQEVGLQLGLALRAQVSFQSRSRAADALSASVAPRNLPDVPGYEAAAVYHPGSSVGAEFYDVFPVSGGWGVRAGRRGRQERGGGLGQRDGARRPAGAQRLGARSRPGHAQGERGAGRAGHRHVRDGGGGLREGPRDPAVVGGPPSRRPVAARRGGAVRGGRWRAAGHLRRGGDRGPDADGGRRRDAGALLRGAGLLAERAGRAVRRGAAGRRAGPVRGAGAVDRGQGGGGRPARVLGRPGLG
ncbi:hypothetical protein GCM10020001_084370 [Nonomuraea salmonea]